MTATRPSVTGNYSAFTFSKHHRAKTQKLTIINVNDENSKGPSLPTEPLQTPFSNLPNLSFNRPACLQAKYKPGQVEGPNSKNRITNGS